jgi:hypothetical protein
MTAKAPVPVMISNNLESRGLETPAAFALPSDSSQHNLISGNTL